MEEPNKGKPYGIITQQRKYKDKRSAPFFVSDMETLLNHANKHAPYTIGISNVFQILIYALMRYLLGTQLITYNLILMIIFVLEFYPAMSKC